MMEKKRVIIKPIKSGMQKYETEEDASKLIKYVSNVASEYGTVNRYEIIANEVENPENIMIDPNKILVQWINKQREIEESEGIRGKRLYPLRYELGKEEYGMDYNAGIEFAKKYMNIYKDFSAVSIIAEAENDITIDMIFNNYSIDGTKKMTKENKPGLATNCLYDIVGKDMLEKSYYKYHEN